MKNNSKIQYFYTVKNAFYTFLFITLLSCNEQPRQKQATKTPNENNNEIKQLVDSTADKFIKKPLINSASIAIQYGNQSYIGHYGELEKGKKNSPNNETIYEIGSLSKTITGTLIAKAVLENKVNPDDSVQTYLKEHYPNLKYGNNPILIRHLLTHSSGFPNTLPIDLGYFFTTGFLKQNTPERINEILEKYNQARFLNDLHTVKIDTIPGFKYSYSNAGTELTAHILEEVYKTDYESLLTNFLSEKVGMKNAKITLDEHEVEKLAVGYHANYPNITLAMGKSPWGASGNINSTVPDMLQFIKYQLENNEIVEESHRPLVQFEEDFGVSYFWNIDSSNKELGTHYFHHGGVPRAQCFIFIIPKYNLGAFIITNQSGENTSLKMRETLNEIFDGIIKNHK